MKRKWLFLALCWSVLYSIMASAALAATPPPAAMADVQQEAARGGYRLITTDQLWAMVSQDAAGVLLVDTRQDWEYAAGHMQGAVNFPMEPTWLSRLTRRGELEQFLGPDKGKHIVFY